jgi:protein-S-isoprenylcysteine O-methyltransferase Ste14
MENTPSEPQLATSSKAEFMPVRSGFVGRGGLWVVGQFVLLVFAFFAGFLWRAQCKSAPVHVIGWFFITTGAFCGVCGALALGRNLTPFPKPSAGVRLVTSGIYRWIRHPLYTAVGCGTIGWGLLRESLPVLFCAGLLLVLLDRKARREEAHLVKVFPGYQAYARRVKGFIPWLY